jgi:hypothetical protein
MSADLHIHICQTKEEEEAAKLFVKHDSSLYKDGKTYRTDFYGNIIHELTEEKYNLAINTNNIWCGEVSWLKAALLEDETYIPETIEEISELIPYDTLTTITKELIEQVEKTFDLPNRSIKEGGVWQGKGYSIAKKEDVIEFLKKHIGKKSFTVSW